jgi:hypothetical protein
MIDFSEGALRIAEATPSFVDFGFVQRPSTGAKILRVDRAGSRFRLALSVVPMRRSEASAILADLIAAKQEGARFYLPLQGEAQGHPGVPVVDGAGQSGKSLALRALTPHYGIRKGWWLSIENEDGQHFLHVVRAHGIADATGDLTVSIEPALRYPFPDGAAVHIARPRVEGIISGDEVSWRMALGGLIEGLDITIEEAE